MSLIDDEPLLRPHGRKSIFPIQYHEMWKMYKKEEGCIWTAEEIKFSNDLQDWEQLDDNTKEVIEVVLGFFAGADMIVNENIAQNFMTLIDIPEARCFYGFQIMMENIHGEVYSLMIENLIRDQEKKLRLLDSINTMPNISALYKWAENSLVTPEAELESNSLLKSYLEEGAPYEVVSELATIWSFHKRLVAYACLEGVMFSGFFAYIFYLKERGVMPGLTFGNELISRDEGLHRDFACLEINMVVHKAPDDQIIKIVKDAVSAVQSVIADMPSLRGLSNSLVQRYFEFVADNLLCMIGIPKQYNIANPIPYMEKISFSGVTNFFEKKVAEYGTSGFEEGSHCEITLDDDY